MAKEIKIPQISEGVDTAIISEILVAEGDTIEEDQAVVSVETDKATAEVPSTAAGTVKEIKVSEGDEVKVGAVVVILEADEEEDEQEEENTSSDDEKETEEADQAPSDEEKEDEDEKEETDDNDDDEEENKKEDKESSEDSEEKKQKDSSSTSTKKSSDKVYASPGVRRLARELEVNLQELEGSGESGRITEKDVKNHKKQKSMKGICLLRIR